VVGRVGEPLSIDWERPPVAEPLSIQVDMRTGYFRVVRISVRGAADVDAGQDHRCPRTILKLAFRQI
jgi:hypothetical protein